MKQLYGLLLGWTIITGLSNCATETPRFDLDVLQGNWRRINSNNPNADSMLLKVEGSSGVILYAPSTSNFSDNELKWTGITSVVSPRNFVLSDKSADGNLWEAAILVQEFDGDSIQQFILRNSQFSAAPGGEQTWQRE